MKESETMAFQFISITYATFEDGGLAQSESVIGLIEVEDVKVNFNFSLSFIIIAADSIDGVHILNLGVMRGSLYELAVIVSVSCGARGHTDHEVAAQVLSALVEGRIVKANDSVVLEVGLIFSGRSNDCSQ